MADPAGDVLAHLATEIVALVVDTNLFRGKVREASESLGIPAKAVFVLRTGGADADAFQGTTLEHFHPSVQVRVRSTMRTGFGVGEIDADAIREALHHQAITGYVDVVASEPIYVEEDEQGSHHWSINVELLDERARA